MKIAHASSVHRAGDTRVLHRECESLARNLGDVTLVARNDPTLQENNVLRTRVLTFEPHPGALGRIRNIVDVARLLRELEVDVVHLHDPELVLLLPWLRRRRCRVIFDVHEDIPAQFARKPTWPAPVRAGMRYVASGLVRVIRRLSDVVIVADPANLRYFPEAETVENFPLESEFAGDPAALEERDRVVYIGAISDARGLPEMLDLAFLAGPEFGLRTRVAGPLQPGDLLSKYATHPGLPHTDFLGVLSRPQVVEELSRARVALALLHDEPNYRHAQPTKVFEYLAAGVPVIASSLAGWQPLFPEGTGVVLVPPSDSASAGQVLRDLLGRPERLAELSREGRTSFRENWSWSSQEPALLRAYERAIASGQG
jgi:glycosyltransferase involved in cell wall biosynthesis